jgi:hypothetical protein
METFLDQFESLVFRKEPDLRENSLQYAYSNDEETDLKHDTADMRIVKDMQDSINQILSPELRSKLSLSHAPAARIRYFP